MKKTYAFALAAVVAFAVPSFAQTITINNVTNGFVRNYHGSGAYGSGGFDTINYGGLIAVKNSGSGDGTTDRAGLLQFNGAGIGTGEGGSTVFNSSLTLYYNPNGTADAGNYTWALWGIPTTSVYANWNGSANTWGTLGGGSAGSASDYLIQNTSPATDLVNDANLFDGVALATITFAANSTLGTALTFSGTTLDDYINSDTTGNLSFILVSQTLGNGTPGALQGTAGGTQNPLLVTTVPEPGTLALMGLGGLASLLLVRGRRQWA